MSCLNIVYIGRVYFLGEFIYHEVMTIRLRKFTHLSTNLIKVKNIRTEIRNFFKDPSKLQLNVRSV